MVTTVPASVPIESFQRLRIETVCRVVVFPVFDYVSLTFYALCFSTLMVCKRARDVIACTVH